MRKCASASQYVCVCACVLIPGRTSSDSELLGISVGVPEVKAEQERRGGERKERAKDGERSRVV